MAVSNPPPINRCLRFERTSQRDVPTLVPSEENNHAFGREQSFVAGPPVNGIQFMVKDAKKYAATGGWGFVQFNEDLPASQQQHTSRLLFLPSGDQGP